MYQKILIATDGSEHAKHALNSAIESAIKWEAELIILTVVSPVSPIVRARVFIPQYIPELEDDLRGFHQRILDEAINVIKNKRYDLKFMTLLEEGHPSSTIVEVARRENVDLIVIGSRGLGGITGWILGSTSRHVVETCTKPILIVK